MTKCLECGCHRRHGSKSSATMARSSSHIVQRRRRGRGGGRVRKTRRSKVTKSDRDPYNPQPKRPRQRRTQPRGCGPGGYQNSFEKKRMLEDLEEETEYCAIHYIRPENNKT
ncbi:hypothetical protein J6590_032983 [Homalodisca vitripennis]|nr:hypothetical protein J6590_032983 [Homalodisca vitripennis]